MHISFTFYSNVNDYVGIAVKGFTKQNLFNFFFKKTCLFNDIQYNPYVHSPKLAVVLATSFS